MWGVHPGARPRVPASEEGGKVLLFRVIRPGNPFGAEERASPYGKGWDHLEGYQGLGSI